MTTLLSKIRPILKAYQVLYVFLSVIGYCLFNVPLMLMVGFIQLLLRVLPQPTITGLANKAVLVTGCDTGIGNALARRLDGIGIRVFAACLKADGPGAKSLQSDCSERLTVIQLDVTKDEEAEAAKQVVKDALNGDVLWGVVNNAGTAVFGEVEWLTVDMFREVLDVNVLGMIRVTKQFLPLLRTSKGRVVNASSIGGLFAAPGSSSYNISKFGVEALGDSLRYELSKWDIKVITIQPGNYAMASAQFQPEIMHRGFERVWESMSSEVREAYGKKYFDTMRDSVSASTGFSSGNLDLVLDDYVKALTLEAPDSRYMPAKLVWKILPTILHFSPSWVGDILFGFVARNWAMWEKTRPGSSS